MIGKLYIQDIRQVTVQKSDLEEILREYLGFPPSAHIEWKAKRQLNQDSSEEPNVQSVRIFTISDREFDCGDR